jgi:hypothetical protein
MVSIINPILNQSWSEFISKHSDATIFHHPAWLSVLQCQYGYKVFAVCILNPDGTICSGIPFCEVRGLRGNRKWISLPFSDHCTPLYDNECDLLEILDYILRSLETGRNTSVEIRSDVSSIHNLFQRHSDSVLHKKELSKNIDDVFSSFKKTQVQQPILKGMRDGLTSIVSTDMKAVHEYYRLHLMTRKRLGVPVQPRKFFDELYENIISKNLGFTVLVFKDLQCISGGIFSGATHTLTYKYGASDDTMLHWRPNNLMVWTAMREAVARGFQYFDFGKTDIVNEGLRKFKSGWGATEQSLYYSYYPSVPKNSLLSTIKDKFASPLIRHTPMFVCRWTGEIFYRYFA